MENAADALKMAGSVLLFVIALSVAILAFSESREAIDTILKYSDRESLLIENDSRFYYLSKSSDTNRYVGKETIIPAIYRAYKENFKIVFNFPDDYYLYKKTGSIEGISTIDLSKQSLGSDLESRKFLNGIIYGKYDDFSGRLDEYKSTFSIEPNRTPLYAYLTDKQSSYNVKEELGTYYINDLDEGTEISDANKTEKRVITYTFVSK